MVDRDQLAANAIVAARLITGFHDEAALIVGEHDVQATFDGTLWHLVSHGRQVSHAHVVPALEMLALARVDGTTIARAAVTLLQHEHEQRRHI